MNKKTVVERIVAQLESELEVIRRSAAAAREAATHEESRAEDSHDTRGLEASYLAGAQAGRAEELQRLVTAYKFMPFREFREGDAIAPGALVELDLDGRKSWYFLAAEGGGFSVTVGTSKVLVITPQAPLGEALLGHRAGDGVEVEVQRALREYEIVSVA